MPRYLDIKSNGPRLLISRCINTTDYLCALRLSLPFSVLIGVSFFNPVSVCCDFFCNSVHDGGDNDADVADVLVFFLLSIVLPILLSVAWFFLLLPVKTEFLA